MSQTLSIIHPDAFIETPKKVKQTNRPVKKNDAIKQNHFIGGKFNYIKNEQLKTLLKIGYQTIDELNLWEYIAQPYENFMTENNVLVKWIKHCIVEKDDSFPEDLFNWLMLQLQFIAEHGENEYRYELAYHYFKSI